MGNQCPSCGLVFAIDYPHDVEQCRTEQQFLKLGVSKQLPKALPKPEVIAVSSAADNKIADLEQAMQLLLLAPTGEDIDAAYSHLNKTREALYKHIAELERRLNVRRTVTKRF